MFCGKCGAKIADDASFCSGCGNAVKKQQPMEEMARTEAAVAVAPIETAPVENVVLQDIAAPSFVVDTTVADPTIEMHIPTRAANEIQPQKYGLKAAIGAIFAPVSVLIMFALNWLFNEKLLELIIDDDMYFEKEAWYIIMVQYIWFFALFLAAVLVCVGLYLLCNWKQRSKLPFFSFLIAPACYWLFKDVILVGVTAVLVGIAQGESLGIDNLDHILLMCCGIVGAIAAYFISFATFHKILKNSKAE